MRTRIGILALIVLLAGPVAARQIVYGPETFTRQGRKPVPASDHFSASAAGPALLRVFNGGIDPAAAARPVRSARVWLNGVEVVGPRDFRSDMIEVPVEIHEGMNGLVVQLRGAPASALTLEIGTVAPLGPPTVGALEAAQAIREAVPGARIHFSQLHGGISGVQSRGRGGFGDEAEPFVPTPLAEGRGGGEAELASALLEYLERFGDAYGVKGVAAGMRLPLDPNDPDFERVVEDPDAPAGWRTLGMVQTHQGIRVAGRFAVGLFDGDGNLHGVLTRLMPTGNAGDPKPALSPADALAAIAGAVDGIAARTPELRWLRGLDLEQQAESVAELVWLPLRVDAESPLRLVYEVQLRRGLNLALVTVDAQSGEIVSSSSGTPSDWFDDGAVMLESAPDETGGNREIRTTLFDGQWYMGYGRNYVDPLGRRFAPGRRLQVADAAGAADRSLTPGTPLSIPALSENTWATEPRYMGNRRAATSLMDNVHRALSYWQARGWPSWDGRGSTLWTSVNNNKDGLGPERNAWGCCGQIQIGDGTRGGRTMASSPEVVGHEFMHNVISATTDLRYRDESGAVNEALADLLGVALTASPLDRLNNDLIGEGSGETIRNFVEPSLGPSPQPEIYSSYVLTSRDSGGVHTNSGIVNKAHALVIQGGSFRGFTVAGHGVTAPVDLIRLANRLRLFARESSMEEFAVAALG